MDDDEECYAEMIDGSYVSDGCRECVQREYEEAEQAYERGEDAWL